jgi:hypothetical protein
MMHHLALFAVIGAGLELSGVRETVGAFLGSYAASLTRDLKWTRPFTRRLDRIEKALGIEERDEGER